MFGSVSLSISRLRPQNSLFYIAAEFYRRDIDWPELSPCLYQFHLVPISQYLDFEHLTSIFDISALWINNEIKQISEWINWNKIRARY